MDNALVLGNLRQYRHKWYSVKNYIIWATFLPQKVSVYLQSLLYNAPRKLPNSVKWRKVGVITPFKVIQGQRVWYQSKAHMRLPVSDQY